MPRLLPFLLLSLFLPFSTSVPTLPSTLRQIPACPEVCHRFRGMARNPCIDPQLSPFCRVRRCTFSPFTQGFVCTRRNNLPSTMPSPSAPSPSATPSNSLPSSFCPEVCHRNRAPARAPCRQRRAFCRVGRCSFNSSRLGFVCTQRNALPSTSSSPAPAAQSATPSTSMSPTASPVPSESSSVTPSATPSISKSSTPSPRPSESSSVTPSATPSISESSTPSPIPSESSSTSPIPSKSSSSSPIPSESSSVTPTVSSSPSASASPPAPRYAGAVICPSGRSVFNVGVVDVDNMLNIALFSVSEETAMAYLDCIQNDRSDRSVEEYLDYAYNNCVGEEPDTCMVNDLATGNCTCIKKPDRCIFPPYRRSVQRCDDLEV